MQPFLVPCGEAVTRRHALSLPGAVLLPRGLTAPARRPNVLFLVSDQHRRGALGIDGDPVAKTPNLDALGRSGVRFDSTYCTNPVCVPARASMLTGVYTHHHRAYRNSVPWPFDVKTIAHHFGRAGYMSGLIGKMHFVDAQTHGFDYHLDFNDWFQYLGPKTQLYADELSGNNSGAGLPQIDDLWSDAGNPWNHERGGKKKSKQIEAAGVSKIPEQDHFESFVARESIRFLKNHGKNQPFLLVTSFLKPHAPFTPSERFARMFPEEKMPLPSTMGKVDPAAMPQDFRDFFDKNSALNEPEQARRRIALYYASLAQMDAALGSVLQALRELQLENDTIVVYTSDHGDMLGEHGLWAKGVFYEPSVSVPMLFRVPGVTSADARCAQPVSHVQLLPTLAELCGISMSAPCDGPSLAGLLREPGRTTDTAVYSEYNLRTPRAKYMIRRGAFKYTYHTNDMAELYNLREDPAEMKNLAALAKFRDKAAEMKAMLFAWYKPTEAE